VRIRESHQAIGRIRVYIARRRSEYLPARDSFDEACAHLSLDPVTRTRRDLAAAYRLAAVHGWDDGIWNHFSIRLPGAPNRFLVKPHGLFFSEVTASNLVVVDDRGTVVVGADIAAETFAALRRGLDREHPDYAR
jgi:hypothetical protein